ncbi:MAG TPA: hypothetical protein VJX71_21340 [Methylomirabilota bacterium]|nr:hypothetical protein [Methylomirabilota bacterium]
MQRPAPPSRRPVTRRTRARAAGVALLMVLTLEMRASEFAQLQSLSDEARRARFDLPDHCTPGISAVQPAATKSDRLIVQITCKPAEPSAHGPKPAQWR